MNISNSVRQREAYDELLVLAWNIIIDKDANIEAVLYLLVRLSDVDVFYRTPNVLSNDRFYLSRGCCTSG